jgi:LAO/AO transport system kinase
MQIVKKILEGDVRTAARFIRDIDDKMPNVNNVLKELYPHTGHAYIIGITGFPGVGKSTLVDQLIQVIREQGKSVGVISIDPTSPFSGGAILGDRIRMQRHALDDDVFIRSLATRGYFGGLTASTKGVVDVMDAMGKDFILVETVGVGQDEVDVMNVAHSTLIVLIPGMGDNIQAIKAGILEVGDIFVINKADQKGVEKSVRDIQIMIEIDQSLKKGEDKDGWVPKIMRTQATTGVGIKELFDQITVHRDFLFGEGIDYYKKRKYLRDRLELIDMIESKILGDMINRLEKSGELDEALGKMYNDNIDPYTLCDDIVERILHKDI